MEGFNPGTPTLHEISGGDLLDAQGALKIGAVGHTNVVLQRVGLTQQMSVEAEYGQARVTWRLGKHLTDQTDALAGHAILHIRGVGDYVEHLIGAVDNAHKLSVNVAHDAQRLVFYDTPANIAIGTLAIDLEQKRRRQGAGNQQQQPVAQIP